MKILMASGECLPFSKTGGLGDVAYSLSKEFAKKRHAVSVITPLYSSIKLEKFPPLHNPIKCSNLSFSYVTPQEAPSGSIRPF